MAIMKQYKQGDLPENMYGNEASKQGDSKINVVIHELLHLGFYQYHLKEKEEETIVNSYGNFLTELLCHSGLKEWIRFHTK